MGLNDETVRIYELQKTSLTDRQRGEVQILEIQPIAQYSFEESGVSSLCTLNNQLFISAAMNRSIDVWDTR